MTKIRKQSIALKKKKRKYKKKKIDRTYVSKHNPNRKKQIFLMIPNGEGWHYLPVKKLSVLLRGITSKYLGDFY